jgi:hypothetical protein
MIFLISCNIYIGMGQKNVFLKFIFLKFLLAFFIMIYGTL